MSPRRYCLLQIVVVAFALFSLATASKRGGKCNRQWWNKKLHTGDKVIIDFEKHLLGSRHKYDPKNGCDGILVEDHTFHMGNRFTVKLDCFQKLLELGGTRGEDWRRKRRTIYKIKEVHNEEADFEDGDVCRPDAKSTQGSDADHANENEYDKYEHCTHKKCKEGSRVQVIRTPSKMKEYDNLIGCTGTLSKVKRSKHKIGVFDFALKHIHAGFCSLDVDENAKNLANEKCKNVKGVEPMHCNEFVPLKDSQKRAGYVSKCHPGKFCGVSTRVQLVNNLHHTNEKDAEYWKNCYGSIHKVSGKKFKIKLDCTDKMLEEGNRCCWPSAEEEGPHVTKFLSKTAFHVE